MRSRFEMIEIGRKITASLTDHSTKRGGVQLFRLLGCKDACIMLWFGLSGINAYLRYTEQVNRDQGSLVPDFSSIEAINSHTKARKERQVFTKFNSVNVIEEWFES